MWRQSEPDRRKLNEGKVIGSKFIVARGDEATLLYRIEATLDPAPGALEVGRKATRIISIAFRR